MPKKEIKRPDEEIMLQILRKNRGSVAELALRLAWNVGLSREEMYNLKWSDISLTEKEIYLPDRTVPLEAEEVTCLENRSRTNRGQVSEYLMASDRNHTHMVPQSISRVARDALTQGGLSDITLVDLRQDYVIRLLEKYDWPYVAKISGTAVSTLYAKYAKYYVKGRGVKAEKELRERPNEFKLWKLIKSEGSSAEGLAMWMVWKLGMRVNEVLDLTWDQVDFNHKTIFLPTRKIEIGEEFATRLQKVKAERTLDADPHVLLTPQSQKPFEISRLSRCVRNALISGGLENLSLRDLYVDEIKESEDEKILRIAAENGAVTRNDVVLAVGLNKTQAYNRLARLVERGELVRVGAKCYLPGTVVSPDEQYAVLEEYLREVKTAYRAELADLLRLNGTQCGVILKRLVLEGKLTKKGQIYSLPSKE